MLVLGAEYIVDYVLLGKSSDGYSLVLIEFENLDTPFAISASNTESDSVPNIDLGITFVTLIEDIEFTHYINSERLATSGQVGPK